MNDMGKAVSGTILLVEDNNADFILAQQCFKEVAPTLQLLNVENGVDAIAFLRREGEFADAPSPDLILLDLNMPLMDGRETLAEIAKDEKLNHLPVIVLTNSQFDDDVLSVYKMRASSYIRKPVDFEQFLEAARKIVDYWFELVVLPS